MNKSTNGPYCVTCGVPFSGQSDWRRGSRNCGTCDTVCDCDEECRGGVEVLKGVSFFDAEGCVRHFRRGDLVEVYFAWAGCAPGYGLAKYSWCDGYTFYGLRDSTLVQVRHTEGLYAGMLTNHYPKDIRHKK